MKVLFIYTNINGFHENNYSFGLASIVSMTRHQGHETKVLIITDEDQYPSIIEQISEFQPQVMGFTSVSSQFSYVKTIATQIKSQFPSLLTVCGGIHPTISPECIVEAKGLDGIFIGEAEYAFVEFLKKMQKGQSFLEADNYAYCENGQLRMNRIKPMLEELDSLPYPDREVYPFEETYKAIGYVPFIFSKGCPFSCTYCSNHAIAKAYNICRNTPRFRSPESSIREIEQTLAKFPATKILIIDEIFGFNKKWREEFCHKYRQRIKAKFQCLLRPNVVNEDFVRLLKESGCYRISMAIESGNEYVRNEVMNRQMTYQQIVKAFDAVRKYKIETINLNMIGLPGETEEMIWDTIKLNRRIKPTFSGVNVFYPYKGTRLGDYCFEKDLVDQKLYSTFSNERRESVLKFSEAHKKRLIWFFTHWDRLVYPHDYKRHFLNFIKKTLIGKYLIKIKRFFLARFKA